VNTDQIAGKWKEMKGMARAKWGEITDDDWDRIEGKREQIVGLIQQKYGRAREDAEREVDDFMRG
jgi:uncharacterized protein YjbJ (UPF0337 family)